MSAAATVKRCALSDAQKSRIRTLHPLLTPTILAQRFGVSRQAIYDTLRQVPASRAAAIGSAQHLGE